MNAITSHGAEARGYPSHSIVALSFTAAEAAARCSIAGVSVISIAIRDADSCRIECQTGAGADELRLRFADHVLTETNR